MELYLDQVETLVLLCLAGSVMAASRGRHVLGAVLAGTAGVLKTWPGLALIAVARARAPWTAGLLALLVAPGLALAGGPDVLLAFYDRTLDATSQELVSHSLWGPLTSRCRRTPSHGPWSVSPWATGWRW